MDRHIESFDVADLHASFLPRHQGPTVGEITPIDRCVGGIRPAFPGTAYWVVPAQSSGTPTGKLIEDVLTRSVIGAFYKVYSTLGFGFFDHLYTAVLERELLARGHRVAREVSVRVSYKGKTIGLQRLDMLVDGKLVIETKSTSQLHKAAARQLYNYLRATDLEVGLLLHFGPKPRFFMMICQPSRRNPPNPPNP